MTQYHLQEGMGAEHLSPWYATVRMVMFIYVVREEELLGIFEQIDNLDYH